jgi:hypothetical protein
MIFKENQRESNEEFRESNETVRIAEHSDRVTSFNTMMEDLEGTSTAQFEERVDIVEADLAQNLLNNWENIKNHPWNGNGIGEDEGELIKSFLLWCVANNKTAYFPTGNWISSTDITLIGNINMVGDGRTLSKLIFNGSNGGLKILKSKPYIDNMWVESTVQGKAGIEFGEYNNKTNFVHMGNFVNCYFRGVPEAVCINLMYDSKFDKCFFDSPTGTIFPEHFSNEYLGACVDIKPNSIEITNQIKFDHCHWEGSYANTYFFRAVGYSSALRHSNISFDQCHVETANKSTYGLWLEYCDLFTITGRYMNNGNRFYTDDKARVSVITLKNCSRTTLSGYIVSQDPSYQVGEAKALKFIGSCVNIKLKELYFFQNALQTFNDNIDISELTTTTDTWDMNCVFGDRSLLPHQQQFLFSLPNTAYNRFKGSIEPSSSNLYGTSYLKLRGSTISLTSWVDVDESSGDWFGITKNGVAITKGIVSPLRKLLVVDTEAEFTPNYENNPNRKGVYLIQIDIHGTTCTCMVHLNGSSIVSMLNANSTLIEILTIPFDVSVHTGSKFYIYGGTSIKIMNKTGTQRNCEILAFPWCG